MDSRNLVWKKGERLARENLKEKGYQIIAQNYQNKYGEIDLIAKQGKVLVFIEVRTKKGEQFGSPEDTLNQKKLKKICLNAKAYVKIKNWTGPYRIDAICIVLNPDNSLARLNHYQDISTD